MKLVIFLASAKLKNKGNDYYNESIHICTLFISKYSHFVHLKQTNICQDDGIYN